MDMKVNQITNVDISQVKNNAQQVQEGDFKFTLVSKIGEEELQIKLNKLLEEIDKQGNKLVKHMDIRDMRTYRETIKSFMNEIVTHSHKFSRENFLDKRGRHRVYGIIRSVDKNLDELANELIREEKNPLTILSKVDEIRGLLLDLKA